MKQKAELKEVKLDWKTADNKGTPDGAVTAYQESCADGYKPHIYIAIEDYYMMGPAGYF